MASIDVRSARRVVRHRVSRRYLRDGGWTKDVNQARDFHTIREVVETCVEKELREVELVLYLDGAFVEIAIRIR